MKTTAIPWSPWRLAPGCPAAKVRRSSSPSYEMAQNNAYSQPPMSAESQPWTEVCVFDLRLVDYVCGWLSFTDLKPVNMEN